MGYVSVTLIKREEAAMRKWFAEVGTAAAAFESRWTLLSLNRLDPALAGKLRRQRQRFDAAMVMGTPEDIMTHGAGLCRGFTAAAGAMEAAGAPDDAYQLGTDPASGARVAIGTQKAAARRVLELYGPGVVWMTPDEVAVLISRSVGAAEFVGTVKRFWPGAVVVT